MNGFISILATYYICGAALAQGPLTADQEIVCAAALETIGVAFLSDEERAAISDIGVAQSPLFRVGLTRFEHWEGQHGQVVAQFEDIARTVAMAWQDPD